MPKTLSLYEKSSVISGMGLSEGRTESMLRSLIRQNKAQADQAEAQLDTLPTHKLWT